MKHYCVTDSLNKFCQLANLQKISAILLVLVLTGNKGFGQLPNWQNKRINSFKQKYKDYAENEGKTAQAEYKMALAAGQKKTDIKSQSYDLHRQPLLWKPALNRLFAQKLAYYSSGSSAISLFDNYAILDPADGRLTVGYNKAFHSVDEGAVTSVLSVALQSNIIKGFTPLVQGGKWQNEIGTKIRYTFGMNRGKIYFFPSQKDRLHKNLDDELALSNADTLGKIREFNRLLDSAYRQPTHDLLKKKKLAVYRKKLVKEYIERITEFQVDSAKYNVLFTRWFSGFIYVPLTKTSLTVSGQPQEFYPLEIGGQGNFLLETNGINIFGNLSISYMPNDNNTTLYTAFGDLTNSKDTNDIKQVNKATGMTFSKDTYTGSYQSFETWRFKPQLVFSYTPFADALANSKAIQNISLDVFGDLQRGKYTVSSVGLGLLLSIHINDDKPLNAEVTYTLRDVDSKLLPDVSGYRKTIFGFRMTLPFNSIIN